jgi:hypothetical protein
MDPNNYRGITLNNSVAKLFTSVINSRLSKWAESNNMYTKGQFGFRQSHNTVDAIFVLNTLINKVIQSNKLFVAFVDFTKAFDLIDRSMLWKKLYNIGVSSKMLTLVKSMYGSVKANVKYQNMSSDYFFCHSGVKQGDNLSPFLFCMYINDLEQYMVSKGASGLPLYMLNIFLILYADDTSIISTSSEGLQNGLNMLYNYCQEFSLKVNVDKTNVVIFRKGGRLKEHKFYYGDKNVKIVSYFKFLGVVMSSTGNMSKAVNTLSDQGKKALFVI